MIKKVFRIVFGVLLGSFVIGAIYVGAFDLHTAVGWWMPITALGILTAIVLFSAFCIWLFD